MLIKHLEIGKAAIIPQKDASQEGIFTKLMA